MAKTKVMFVDDERDFLRLVKLNLEDTYEIMTLSDTQDIVSRVNRFKPDVIFLDLSMWGSRGIETCKTLNNVLSEKNIPIILLSALNSGVDRLKARKAGIVDWLTKPVEAKDLIVKIEKAMEAQ